MRCVHISTCCQENILHTFNCTKSFLQVKHPKFFHLFVKSTQCVHVLLRNVKRGNARELQEYTHTVHIHVRSFVDRSRKWPPPADSGAVKIKRVFKFCSQKKFKEKISLRKIVRTKHKNQRDAPVNQSWNEYTPAVGLWLH